MIEQQEALRLDELIKQLISMAKYPTVSMPRDREALYESAAELRRQHSRIAELEEANRELLEALKDLLEDTQHSHHACEDDEWCPVAKAGAALQKHGGAS
ncbi:MAG: hypothetical protein KGL39_36005 [Patescibacteria group bacterium]|nr:hypothetical protein [Patescibacteria group bacterium]